MISVIIPTLNEAASLGLLLASLSRERICHEIIVVDGGSRDDTMAVAKAGCVKLAMCGPSRGQQLCAGAALSAGDTLLFLHADTRFPNGGLVAVQQLLNENPTAPGGNFRLLFDGDTDFDRWLEDFYAWIRRRGFYYGDSGIFVRRSVYDAMGGMRPIALMEDYDFVQRLEREGSTLCVERPPLVSSSRRFRGRSTWSIVLGWLVIHVLFHLRVPVSFLAWFYDSGRAKELRRAEPRKFSPNP